MSDLAPYQPALTRWGHTWRGLLVLAISAIVMSEQYGTLAREHPGWLVGDVLLGLAALVVVHQRRAHPLPVALGLAVLATVSAAAAGPATLALFSAATRRITWEVVLLGVVSVASAEVFYWVFPEGGQEPMWVSLTANVAGIVAIIALGMYVGSRRELLWTLRQRAERAEAERDLRSGKARAEERARLAREMHDVLAHRISQVSMRSGALAFRTDLDAEALRAGIGEVQEQANAALNDLRAVLGVLRDRETGQIANRPQPSHRDVASLVEEARAGGARVDLDDRIGLEAAEMDETLGRTIYRIVQEGITNAGKHAAGARLTVEVSGSPCDGVELLLRNPIGFAAVNETASPRAPRPPGSGLGLVGLAERAELAGGHLTHGTDGASHVVHAWLPWSE